uniref:GST N-terminal domain-containing protein n=1 Tax=Picea sitchensis TaxID=3332 RepID=A9NZ76_PICSI|nr:unknown [Picea sitchensis]
MAGLVAYPCNPSLFRPSPVKSDFRRSRWCSPISAELKESPSSIATEDSQAGGSMGGLSFSVPPGFKPPEPRRFYVRGDKWGAILSASLALPFRLGCGAFAQGYKASWVPESEVPENQYTSFQVAGHKLVETSELGPRPEKPIEIYEFESCPFCRKVREIVSILNLDVLYYPCPRNGPNFRPKAVQLGGKQQFPYMVDSNTGISMYESDDIINYLVGKYGDGNVPLMLSLGLFTTLTAGFAMIGRLGKASPFCKIVREALVELELPHLYHCTARGSPNRQNLFEKTGHSQVPYLEDPNTGVKMFESAEIIEFLRATYAVPLDQ